MKQQLKTTKIYPSNDKEVIIITSDQKVAQKRKLQDNLSAQLLKNGRDSKFQKVDPKNVSTKNGNGAKVVVDGWSTSTGSSCMNLSPVNESSSPKQKSDSDTDRSNSSSDQKEETNVVASGLLRQMENYRKEELFTDLTIITEDGKEYKCHKLVISAVSETLGEKIRTAKSSEIKVELNSKM
jgi:hypothetical protein